MRHRVGIVTCVRLPEPDPDAELFLGALRGAGITAEPYPWDAPGTDPGAYELCLLRSTWNYPQQIEAFLAWVDRADAASRLCNSGRMVRWNVDKRYLAELASDGVPIVPTAWVEHGSSASLSELTRERGWDDVVLKPSVSAASWRTRRFRGEELAGAEAQAFLDGLARDGHAMVQPYLPSVEAVGERALVWIDGAFTHAVRKMVRFTGDDEQVSDALALTAGEYALGEHVLAAARGLSGEDPLYARVDVMVGPDGEPLLSELELIEPSLYLLQSPDALARLVLGVLDRLQPM